MAASLVARGTRWLLGEPTRFTSPSSTYGGAVTPFNPAFGGSEVLTLNAGESVTVRSADGTELHAEVFGPDESPTFVLIPGWVEVLQLFDLLTRGLLGRGFRVVETPGGWEGPR